jgi:hypothetical protein
VLIAGLLSPVRSADEYQPCQYPDAGWCNRRHQTSTCLPRLVQPLVLLPSHTTPTYNRALASAVTLRSWTPRSFHSLATTAHHHLSSPMSGTSTARVRYVPLERPRGEYAARRALFLQSYRFSFPAEGRPREEGLREAVARARAGLARAWRGWRPRADLTMLLGCFRPCHRHKHYRHNCAFVEMQRAFPCLGASRQ